MSNKAKAIELLGEKGDSVVPCIKCRYAKNKGRCPAGCFGYDFYLGNIGKNQMHSKAVEVVVGLLKRISELEEKNKGG